uniref:DUF5641 domain-containing protein n=1 Tax=Bombyx mori TaxID=7091 RepID=A0A8R2R8Y2_BOMMO|nr:uncharacterized protein LOC105842393 [Bombyx mori]XP_037873662.1 uncharacterized protein LOC119629972 [Bombyx mori]XP_037873663.1 uncharacterized protein LOC119629973 [Bombyx mori]XP_037874548.1 uncharacterized protein LOC119630131 [Bombyx mori]
MDIKSLKKTRSSHKAKLTIFKTYIDSLLPSKRVNEVQAFELKARLDKILDLYNEFDSVQTDLESLVEISDDEHKEREIFENSYFGCVAFAQKMLSAASADQDAGSVTGSNINTGPSELQIRNKWRTNRGQPQPGEMVLIKDDRLPPNRWLLGRVTTVYPGADGVNRVADVKTTSGTLRRAWNRLCPLPVMLDQKDASAPRGPVC